MINRKLDFFNYVIFFLFALLFLVRLFFIIRNIYLQNSIYEILNDISTLLILLGISLYFIALFPLLNLILIFLGIIGHVFLLKYYNLLSLVFELICFLYLSYWWLKWKIKGNK